MCTPHAGKESIKPPPEIEIVRDSNITLAESAEVAGRLEMFPVTAWSVEFTAIMYVFPFHCFARRWIDGNCTGVA